MESSILTRYNPTHAEAALWQYLRRRQIPGKRFRRQYSIGRYIVDFFCVECDIAIELKRFCPPSARRG
jgi:very-short-patch-repair endonuclease